MKLLRVALATLFVSLLAPFSADAHSGVQSYVYMSLFDDGVQGRVEYPIADLADVIGIDLSGGQSTIDELSDAERAAIVDYTRNHLEMGDDDGLWELVFEGTVSYLDAAGGYVLVPFDVAEDFDERPRRWSVTYDGVIESNPERDALFLIEDDWQTATFRNEGEHLLGFSVGNETQLIELESVSATESLREVARRGTIQVDKSAMMLAPIVGVLAVSLLAGASRARRDESSVGDVPGWKPTAVETARRIGIVVIGLMTSLWVVGLTGIGIDPRLVMATGGLSAVVAAATWWASDTQARGGALVVGLLSGLVLGASFVEQLLDRSAPIRSLVAYSVGSVATVAVAAALLVPMMIIVRQGRLAGLAGVVAIAIVAGAGLVWLVEAAAGVKFPLRTGEILIADAVTSPFVVAVVTVALGVAVFWSLSKPQHESHSDPDRSPSEPTEPIEVR